jgi:hypothetical protein
VPLSPPSYSNNLFKAGSACTLNPTLHALQPPKECDVTCNPVEASNIDAFHGQHAAPIAMEDQAGAITNVCCTECLTAL